MNYLCVDFGGTKTLISVISDDGTVVQQTRFETPHDYDDFLNQLSTEIKELPETFQHGVMAVPGLIDHATGVVLALGNRPWENFDITTALRERTGVEMRIMNDARLATLAEAKYLQSEYRRVLYITISTGIGVGLAVDGSLVESMIDTEFGKMPIVHNAEFTPWEEVASGRAIVATYGKRASDINEPEIWKEIAHLFALGVGPACATFQPDAIVFGGGVGQLADRFVAPLQEELRRILHPVIRQPQVLLPCHYRDDSVIQGCYELGKQAHEEAA